MNYLLVAFLLAFVIPILFGSWHLGFIGLAAQTLFLAAIVIIKGHGFDAASLIQLVDLGLVRGILVPIILIGTLKKVGVRDDFDFVPANFLYWTVLFILIGSGLWFGYLVFPEDFQKTLQCGVGAAGVLTAFFVLALQPIGLGQIFAIILLESSIILLEFINLHHQNPFLQLGFGVLFLLLILIIQNFIKRLAVIVEEVEEQKAVL